jgi:hypothetical protein
MFDMPAHTEDADKQCSGITMVPLRPFWITNSPLPPPLPPSPIVTVLPNSQFRQRVASLSDLGLGGIG